MRPVQVAPAQGSSSGVDSSDIATLNDALGSAGVDLRVRALLISLDVFLKHPIGRGGIATEITAIQHHVPFIIQRRPNAEAGRQALL